MTFRLTIDTDNAAFADDPGAELARILRDAADALEYTGEPVWPLRDANGNRVGTWELEHDGPDPDGRGDISDAQDLEDALRILGIGGTVEAGDRLHLEHERERGRQQWHQGAHTWSWQLEPSGPWHMRQPLHGAFWTGAALELEPSVTDVVAHLVLDWSYLEEEGPDGLTLADIDTVRNRAAWLQDAAGDQWDTFVELAHGWEGDR